MFGLPVLTDFTHRYVGPSGHPDPRFFIWAMAWWPHAILHGLNPMWTRAVWAPAGYNLAWATGAPGPSLVLAPVTMTAGPIASYNTLALLAAPSAATTAYLLCRHITGRWWPSLVGGWVFGFSTYEVAHVGLQVNLELIFLVPIAVHLVLLRLQGAIAPRPFVAALTLVLVSQFLTSTEVFASMVVFGAIALIIALLAAGPDQRPHLVATAMSIALSFGLAALLAGPYLYYVFAYGIPHRTPIGADLLSFLIPTSMTRLHLTAFDGLVRRFPGSLQENTAYVGPALIAVLILFAVARRRTVAGKVLLGSLAAVTVATLGETLFVAGRRILPLPWRAVGALPLLNNAFPRRFAMYVFLALSLMLAMWLSEIRWKRSGWALALLVPMLLFPAPSLLAQHGRVVVPRFFEAGIYRRYIRPGDTILIALPRARDDLFPQSQSMVMQAQSGFTFRMVVAYTGPRPREYAGSPILQALTIGVVPAVGPPEFQRFLRSHGITAIVMQPRSTLEPGITKLVGHPPMAVADVLLYELSGSNAGARGSGQAASRRFFLPRAM